MKRLTKLISFLLAIIMLLSCTESVMPVFAAEMLLNENTEEQVPEEEDAEYVEEVEELRTENSRTYLMSDGSYEYNIYTYRVDGIQGRAHDTEEESARINGTYIKSTDTAGTDHSEESRIVLSSSSVGILDSLGWSYEELELNYYIKSVKINLPVIDGQTGSTVYAYAFDDEIPTNLSYSNINSGITCVDYAKVTDYGTYGKFISLDITSALRSNPKKLFLKVHLR